MISIIKATLKDAALLTFIGKKSFVEAHGRSAPENDIKTYVNKNFTEKKFKEELEDSNNIFNIIYFNKEAVGYSKIIFDFEHSNIPFKNVTKLERLYLIEGFHGNKLGFKLFNFNLNTSKKHNQSGMWLYVWVENHKAINFYKKIGFKIIGKHDFKISITHANPNHQMLLTF